MRKFFSVAGEFLSRKHRHRTWMRIVGALACVVVFCTTYALILPAITLETVSCGMEEHTHTETCYAPKNPVEKKELICSRETLGIHEHTKGCYDSDKNLICGSADYVVHTHTENCYGSGGERICDLDEIKEHVHTDKCYKIVGAHTHTDDCYTTEQVLICEIEENEEHTHGEECYEQKKVLTCDSEESKGERELICGKLELHTHTDACYDENHNLVCGKLELKKHQHEGEACFKTSIVPDDADTLTCGLEENENHTHTKLCYGTWTVICGIDEHIHTDKCYISTKKEKETEKETEAATEDGQTKSASEVSQEEPADDEGADGESEEYGVALMSEDGETGDTVTDTGNTEAVAQPLDVSGYITSAELKYKENDSTEWQTITGDTVIPGYADLRLDVTYGNVSLDALLANGGMLTYTIPSIMRDPVANGSITSGSDTVGRITVEGNILTIDFEETWLKSLKDGGSTTLDGTFYVESEINLSEAGEGGKTEIKVGNVTIEANFEQNIVAQNCDVDIEKAVSDNIIHTDDGDYLEYTLKVTAGRDGCPEVKVVDAFTSNSSYITYVGINTAAAQLSGTGIPSEIIADGKTHGSIYKGAMPSEDTPIPPENGSLEEPGSLVWVIGTMSPNETRTLTYRVKLKDGYTFIQNSENKVISNAAEIYSKTYPRGNSTANYEPKAGIDLRKTASEAVRQEDGSYVITYTVSAEAYSTNNFVLKNVRIEDSLNHPNNSTNINSLEYINYVENSIRLYNNKNASGNSIGFTNGPTMNEDTKGFVAWVGDMAPGEVRCIQYQIHVGLKAIGEAIDEDRNTDLQVKNRALAYSDNARNGSNNWLQAFSNTKTIRYDHWAKKLVGDPLAADASIAISGTVYDATGYTPVIESSPPGSFTAPVGSYQYTVTVNDLGDWDVTSASMRDTLGDQHMQFVGYVKVEAYDPGDHNAVKQTIWVKVDGSRTFNFTLKQLGLSANNYAYRLTYYAKPVQMEGISQVVVANTFQLSGDIIIGKGYQFILTGIEAKAEVTVQGDNSFEAQKMAWYYEGARTSTGNWSKGALYWAIKVDGTNLVAGTYIQDYLQTGSNYVYLREDSLVGVYIGSFPTGTLLTSYPDVESALSSGCLTSVDASYYSVESVIGEKTQDISSLTLKMERTLELSGASMYIIVKLEPAFLPPHPFAGDPIYYHNQLKTSDDGTTWIERGTASKVLYEGSNIWKRLGTTFTYDGSTIDTKTSVRGGTVIKELLPEPGYYISWEVKVNETGDLSGKYRILDTIPDGMELAYVRIKWRGSNTRKNPGASVAQITDLGSSWTAHTVSAGLDGEAAMSTYYYTNGNQICWDVDNLIAGKAKDSYSVDFQVVCRVTDPDVLLGGQEKEFNNQVSLINSRGVQQDFDTNGVTISTSTMTKSAVKGGSSIPFTITVNPLGEDLLEGADKLTVVDTLSAALKLDATSITVVNTKTNASVDFTASLSGQTLKIIVPDNQPLTIRYTAKVQAAPGTEVEIKNVAHWEGYAATGGSSFEDKEYSYAVGGTAGGATTPSVEIVKYDQNDLTKTLSGAAFKMVEGTMKDGVFTASTDSNRVWTGSTDENGKLKFGTTAPLMAYNTVYQITETAAPEGYIPDSTPYYFIVAKANADETYPDYPEGVHVHYDSSTYTCEIANHKGEAYVEKQFRDAQNQNLSKIDGSYRFGIYDTENPAGKPLQIVTINYSNGETNPENEKAVFTNLTPGATYYIYELDDSSKPIKDNTLATVDGKTFDVSYNSGSAVTIPSDGSAAETVTVTNQVHYSELPETGGPGTLPFIMGGLLLIAVSLLHGYSMRRKNERRLNS